MMVDRYIELLGVPLSGMPDSGMPDSTDGPPG